jgi:hypothetical protein
VAQVAADGFEEKIAAKVVDWNNKALPTGMYALTGSAKAVLVSASRGTPWEEEQK